MPYRNMQHIRKQNPGKIWNLDLKKVPKSTREIRRALVDEVGCGWPVKWGLQYDLALPNGLHATGNRTLHHWTLQQWVDFAKLKLNTDDITGEVRKD